MVTRREWLCVVAAATGCATPGRPLEEAFPASVAGEWTLKRSAPVPVDDAAEDVRAMGVRRAARAEYAGPAEFTLTLYEMKSGGNAFEMLQKWRPSEGRMGFHHGRFFGVAESPGAAHAVLQKFADGFDKAFGGA